MQHQNQGSRQEIQLGRSQKSAQRSGSSFWRIKPQHTLWVIHQAIYYVMEFLPIIKVATISLKHMTNCHKLYQKHQNKNLMPYFEEDHSLCAFRNWNLTRNVLPATMITSATKQWLSAQKSLHGFHTSFPVGRWKRCESCRSAGLPTGQWQCWQRIQYGRCTPTAYALHNPTNDMEVKVDTFISDCSSCLLSLQTNKYNVSICSPSYNHESSM